MSPVKANVQLNKVLGKHFQMMENVMKLWLTEHVHPRIHVHKDSNATVKSTKSIVFKLSKY